MLAVISLLQLLVFFLKQVIEIVCMRMDTITPSYTRQLGVIDFLISFVLYIVNNGDGGDSKRSRSRVPFSGPHSITNWVN